ncbi:3-ketoacyl-CoA thiolase, mitochondrial-like isoform X1 [Pieris napi]|uniref:3-ketoacyl-CoA thiolase, mitochondrial-like isoform X1 n=1 Tax=Pieris napi TaxID=78633 RepID=UPI001FBA84B8|nr:3-ketoacyl-CoA thiolase, mitochondrial-like isoform X1 [Pieris napi]
MILKSKDGILGIFVIGAKRTPFCKYGGSLRELPASHAFAAAAKDAIQSSRVDPNLIDCTIVGNINFLSQCDGGKTPRYCGIYSGVPIEKPALGVNRTCATGIQALISGGMEILTNSANLCLTGGSDIMSSLPMLVRNVRFGTSLGTPYLMEDHIKTPFLDTYTGTTLQKTAENIAKLYGITRKDVDEFTLKSHLKWKKAEESNTFEDEITKLKTVRNKKEHDVIKDELTNPEIKLEDLTASPSVSEDSIVTFNNSAAPADGAASILLASEEIVKMYNLNPMARITGWSCVGSDPYEGLGVVAAIKKLTKTVDFRMHDIDLFEINETFASQSLAVIKELDLDETKVNVNGGALAMGHPVSATGARMITHIVHQLRLHNLRTAIAASSCGGGQGVAVMLETI